MNHLRIGTWLRCFLYVLACALLLDVTADAAEPAHVTEVRHRRYAQFERIVLELDRGAPVERPAAAAGQLEVLLRARPAKERQIVAGAIRIEQTEEGDTRISAAIGSLQVRVFTLPSPPRLVIDLGDAGLTAFVAPQDGTPIFAGSSVLPAEPPPTTAAEAEPRPAPPSEPLAPPSPAAEPAAEVEPEAGPDVEPDALAAPSPAVRPLFEPLPVEPESVPEVEAEPAAEVELEAVPEPVVEAPEEAALVVEAPPALETPASRPPRPFPAPLRPEAEPAPAAGADVAAQPPPQTRPAPARVPAGPAARVPVPPVARKPAFELPGGGSSAWWIAAAVGLGVLAGTGLLLRRRRRRASFAASAALEPVSADIGPEDLLPRGDRIELLEKRIDEEARERLHLESRLAEMSEEQKVLRDRLRRMTRQQREGC